MNNGLRIVFELIKSTLSADLVSILSNSNMSGALVGMKIAKAYNTYMSSAMNNGGGSAIGMTGIGSLMSDLSDIYSKTNFSGTITAQKVAKSFNNALGSFQSIFQTTIVTAPGLGLLMSDMIDIHTSLSLSSTQFPQKFATALDTFTKSAICSGTAPGPTPFSGNLS